MGASVASSGASAGAHRRPRPVIEPTLALALALRSTPGAYALLVGSGLSSAAGIPTGWGIVLDLIRQIAPEGTADTPGGLEAWYRAEYEAEPDYSALLEAVASTPAERRDRLRSYFEPTAEERDDGLKLPTKAHRAIARLAAEGYIRVIITTNFDQLLETALRDEGVTPAVISTPDGVAGAMPLQHERVTVIKLHGDYTDVRIKNTPEELEGYDPAIDRLLDRVFDEYGLVLCGWSAAWDDALRAAITRAPNRRFSTFWAQKGAMAPEAERLVESRHATVIPIDSADAFFDAVAEKVASLEDLDRPHPLSKAVAVASFKRYLPSAESRIRLHDLLMAEVEAVRARAVDIVPSDHPTKDLISATVPHIETAADTLMTLMATGVQWGEARHRRLWRAALERLGTIGESDRRQYDVWSGLLKYPAQLAFYAAGVAAAVADDEALASLVLEPMVSHDHGRRVPAAVGLHCYAVVDHDAVKLMPGYERRYTPMSDRLAEAVREPLRGLLPDDATFADAFDRFELIVALAYMHGTSKTRMGAWFPLGRVTWRRQNFFDREADPVHRLKAEIDHAGADWFMLRRGLFDGSTEALNEMYQELKEQAKRRGG